jgi:hypothetical protein
MTRSHIALTGTIAALLIPATIHTQTRKTPAPIVDGPDYLASQGQTAAPAAKADPDNPTCLAAMQVIGHDGEAVVEMGGPVHDLDDVQAALGQANMAESLLKATTRITTTGDVAYCQKIIAKIPRMYPAYRDEHDHMSTGRIITVLNMLRIEAADKKRLEDALSRDISH